MNANDGNLHNYLRCKLLTIRWIWTSDGILFGYTLRTNACITLGADGDVGKNGSTKYGVGLKRCGIDSWIYNG